ncbi:MAG: hypothetical protein NW224_08420, partial [Leptolyngbyaceae cyanobacterium bins.302]|nr:hypothetical protein [Leptolyngbyaceae cyanobacterium bins.302]
MTDSTLLAPVVPVLPIDPISLYQQAVRSEKAKQQNAEALYTYALAGFQADANDFWLCVCYSDRARVRSEQRDYPG